MAVLTGLPPELLRDIFHNLGSIDDVHSLARACRAMYNVIKLRSTYVDIMRSIIYHGPQHRFDVMLCQMLGLDNEITGYFKAGGTSFVPTPFNIPPHEPNTLEAGLLAVCNPDKSLSIRNYIPDETIYDILARWQGLRLLQDLWLDRQLNDADYVSTGFDYNSVSHFQMYMAAEERNNSNTARHRETQVEEWYTSFNSDQKGRFHASVTRLWLLNEIGWALTKFIHNPDFRISTLEILEIYKKKIDQLVGTPLLDHLDLYAMYSFLYQHLLPVHSRMVLDRNNDMVLLRSSENWTGMPTNATRYLQFFLVSAQATFQPPDIIELVVRDKLLREPGFRHAPFGTSNIQYRNPGGQVTALHYSDYCTTVGATAGLHILNAIHCSTFTQNIQRPATPINPWALSANGNRVLNDEVDIYLKKRAQTQFDCNCNPEGRDISEVFDKNWKSHARWQIWWWANSEDKARAKMERWRLE